MSGEHPDDIRGPTAGARLPIASGLAYSRFGQTHARSRHFRRLLLGRVSEAVGQSRPATRRLDSAPANLRDPDDGVEGRAHLRRPDHVFRAKKGHAAIFRARRVSLPSV